MTTLAGFKTTGDLVGATAADLAPRAFDKARGLFGHVVTYSPKVFIHSPNCVVIDAGTAPSPKPPRTSPRPT